MQKEKTPRNPEEGVQRGSSLIKYDEAFFARISAALDEWSAKEENIWLNDFFLDQGFIMRDWTRWKEKSKVFEEAHTRALERQEGKITRGGLKSKFNANIAKAVLGHVHGWEADHDALMKSCLKGVVDLINQAKPKGSLIEDN